MMLVQLMPRFLFLIAVLVVAATTVWILLFMDRRDEAPEHRDQDRPNGSSPPSAQSLPARPEASSPEDERAYLDGMGQAPRSFPLAATVRNENGEALPLARMRWLPTSHAAQESLRRSKHLESSACTMPSCLQAEADRDGRVVLAVPRSPARGVLLVSAEGHARYETELELPVGEAGLDLGELRLTPGRSLQVEVQDQQARPLSGAVVSIGFSTTRSGSNAGWRHRISDARGRVRFDSLPMSLDEVHTRLSGYLDSYVARDRLPEDPEQPLHIRLSRGESLSGRVLDHDGSPVADVSLSIRLVGLDFDPLRQDPAFRARTWAVTDEEGRFHNFGLEAGQAYRLHALAPDGRSTRSKRVHSGDPVELRFAKQHTVGGRLVLGDGSPASAARLAWISEDPEKPADIGAILQSDEDGRFEVGVPAGRYRLAVWHRQGEWLSPRAIPLPEESSAFESCSIPSGGTLEVQVPGGAPASGELEAEFLVAPDSPWAALHPLREWERDAEHGMYRLEGLSSGQHAFQFVLAGHVPIEFVADIEAGKRTRIELTPLPLASLQVSARYEDGQPASELGLQLIAADPALQGGLPILGSTDARGRLRFDSLPPGQYAVHEQARLSETNRGLLTRTRLEPGINPLELTIPARFELRIHVRDREGSLAGAYVYVQATKRNPPGLNLPPALTDGSLRTDADGMLVLRTLPPGEYEIGASRPLGIPTRTLVQLRQRTQRIEIQLAGHSVKGRVTPSGPRTRLRLIRKVEDERLDARTRAERSRSLDDLRQRGFTAQGQHGSTFAEVAAFVNGSFHFREVPDGDYWLVVDSPHGTQTEAAAVEVRGAARTGILLELQPVAAVVLELKAWDHSRYPLGFRIELWSSSGATPLQEKAAFDPGSIRFERLVADTYRLRFHARGSGDQQALGERSVVLNPPRPANSTWSPP